MFHALSQALTTNILVSCYTEPGIYTGHEQVIFQDQGQNNVLIPTILDKTLWTTHRHWPRMAFFLNNCPPLPQANVEWEFSSNTKCG